MGTRPGPASKLREEGRTKAPDEVKKRKSPVGDSPGTVSTKPAGNRTTGLNVRPPDSEFSVRSRKSLHFSSLCPTARNHIRHPFLLSWTCFLLLLFWVFLQDCHQGVFPLLMYISGFVLFYHCLESSENHQLPDENVSCYLLFRGTQPIGLFVFIPPLLQERWSRAFLFFVF